MGLKSGGAMDSLCFLTPIQNADAGPIQQLTVAKDSRTAMWPRPGRSPEI